MDVRTFPVLQLTKMLAYSDPLVRELINFRSVKGVVFSKNGMYHALVLSKVLPNCYVCESQKKIYMLLL